MSPGIFVMPNPAGMVYGKEYARGGSMAKTAFFASGGRGE